MLRTIAHATDPTSRARSSRVPAPEHPPVPVIERVTFIEQFGKDFHSGQHVTFLGPTQRGKTTMALQLLSRCISPDRRGYILAGKPTGRDPTMEEAANKLNMRQISSWPPERQYGDKKKNGFVLHPLGKPTDDADAEDVKLERNFRAALKSLYASRKPVVVVVDETAHVYDYLKIKKPYEASLMRGAPTVSMWSLIQRGRNISYHAYNAPEHIFIFFDPDASNRERYGEIGGVDARWIQDLVKNLKTETIEPRGNTVSQALYIRRSGPQISIVDIH